MEKETLLKEEKPMCTKSFFKIAHLVMGVFENLSRDFFKCFKVQSQAWWCTLRRLRQGRL
jgi:hypothetical protein